MLPAAVVNRIDRKAAVPTVPPLERKKLTDAVAAPMSVRGTSHCASVVSVCIDAPSPAPIRAMPSAGCHSGLSARSVAKTSIAAVNEPTPATRWTLNRPVRAIIRPVSRVTARFAATVGRVARPAAMGLMPRTSCR